MPGLKQLREQKNLTQEELSEKSGISVRTIQRIESGTKPKGYTLKALSAALKTEGNELLFIEVVNDITVEKTTEIPATESTIDYSKIKLINLSSILFVILPPFNILAPVFLSHVFKQKNIITRQIISLQIFWTILAPVVFMLGILLKLGRSFTIVLLASIILSNIFLVLRNLSEIDRNKKLHYKLNFSII